MSSPQQYNAPENADSLFVPAIVEALKHLVTSAEPAVVFTSLARLCVPLVCDSATVVILDGDEQAYRISWPRPTLDSAPAAFSLVDTHRITADSVLTPIVAPEVDGHPPYRGVLALSYQGRQPTPAEALVGQFLVERTVALIHAERVAAALTAESAKVANLQLALASNRDIGVAMGIIMAGRKVTSEQAFDLLRTASQNTHRKLRDIAIDVALTGVLETSETATPARQ